MPIYNGGLNIITPPIVTSWSSTTSDSNVPSEKLVKDDLTTLTNSVSGKMSSYNLTNTTGKVFLLGTAATNSAVTSINTTNCYAQSNNLYSSGFYVSSLRELKENIVDSTMDATEMINSQKIVEFNYKDDPDKSFKIGLIADDTDPSFLDKEKKTVDLYNTCGILMKAVQELSRKVQSLEKALEESV